MDTQGTPRSFSTGDVLGRPTIVTSFVILVRLLPDKTVSRHYTSGRSANKEPPGYSGGNCRIRTHEDPRLTARPHPNTQSSHRWTSVPINVVVIGQHKLESTLPSDIPSTLKSHAAIRSRPKPLESPRHPTLSSRTTSTR